MRPSSHASRISADLVQATSNWRSESELLAAVELVSHLRSLRTKYLPPRLLGEPAWDILLRLLRAELVDEAVTTEQLSEAARLPVEVSNRWIDALVESGLCSWLGGANDPQVKLTPEGDAVLRDFFVQMPQPFAHRP